MERLCEDGEKWGWVLNRLVEGMGPTQRLGDEILRWSDRMED